MRLSRADSRNGRKGETATENGRVSVRLLESARQTDRAFDYLIPEDMHISPGAIVTVPFGRQNRLVSAVADRVYYPGGAPDASDGPKPDGEAAADGAGYGAAKQKNAVQYGAAADRRGAGDGGELSDGGDSAEGAPRLKYVASVINSASLTPELLSLAHFMRARTLCTFGDAVKTMLPSAALSNISEIYFAAEEDASVPPQSAPVYAFVRENSPVTADALYAKFGRGVQPVLAKLSAKGAIIRRRQDHEPTNVKHETVFGLAADRAEAERAMNGEGKYALRGKRQKELLGELLDGEKTLTELKKVIPEPRATAAALEKKGLVRSEKREIFRNPYLSAAAAPAAPPVTKYSDEQTRAIHTLCELADGAAPAAALLHGITGSGKTLVIKAVIDSVLESGRGAIVLVPEIALTPQTVGVYRSFFGDRIAVMHSSLSSGERYDAWRRVRDGDADVVIGTRSAVFAPVRNLGLIVIDEEQEHTYKSDTTPKYLAHDIARKRCADTKSLMLLASATPSLASYRKAKTGVYTLVELKNRYGNAHLPEVVTVDMRREIASGNASIFSDEIVSRLKKVKADGEQAILFLNRRGYNSVITCRRCGENIKCPNCSVSLTYHATAAVDERPGENYLSRRARTGVLTCHYCGFRCAVPMRCPSCSDGNLLFMGYGTQRAAAELEELVPGLRVLRMDTDTTRRKFSHEEILDSFRRGDADVLLGTQMVTKGHDFPRVALAGVLNADASLYLDDYRAGERTFAMLTQLIGRAGRAGGDGVAVIQTTNPSSEVIALAARQDYPAFYEREIKLRSSAKFPPFCDLVQIAVSSKNDVALSRAALALAAELKSLLAGDFSDVAAEVYGPFEAPIYKVQSEFRMRIVVKCVLNARSRAMFAALGDSFARSGEKGVTFSVDFNPSGI